MAATFGALRLWVDDAACFHQRWNLYCVGPAVVARHEAARALTEGLEAAEVLQPVMPQRCHEASVVARCRPFVGRE